MDFSKKLSRTIIRLIKKRPAVTQLLNQKLSRKKVIAIIKESGLFDKAWYLSQYPDVAKANLCPVFHYISFGAAEGRKPHPLFDGQWYLSHYPDVQDATCVPFVHFVMHGAKEGRLPNPLFDLSLYLQENRDVVLSNISPVIHLLKWGYYENRIYSAASFEGKEAEMRDKITNFLTKAFLDDKEKKTILIFGHEATTTGAPIALLGIIKGLVASGKFHFITILNRGGELASAYQKVSSTLILEEISKNPQHNVSFVEWIAEYCLSLDKEITCLTNTAESKNAAEIFGKKNFKVISLIHEMPTAINEHFGGQKTIKTFEEHSDCLIVPSLLTAERLVKEYDITTKIKVINPGVTFSYTEKDIPLLTNNIHKQLGLPSNTPLIISCGSYEYRKGFDLFLQIGSKIIQAYKQKNQVVPTFLWIGPGLNQDYAQQKISEIRNSAIKQHFVFLDAQEKAEEWIAAADVFLLCSREDPFPLVAIEAAGYDIPIVLFSGTTGTEGTFPKGSYYAAKKFDITALEHVLTKALKKNDYQPSSHWIRSNFSVKKYAEQIGFELLSPKKTTNLASKKRVLLIGYGPPPILGMKSEGSGLRLWGLAQALAKTLSSYEVVLAYKVALDKKAFVGTHDGVQVIRWEDSTLKEEINKATTLLFSYCLGQDTEYLISLANKNHQIILDCYVPIFSEVCARQSGDLQREKEYYIRDLKHWNNSLRHGDIFLCANQNQVIYYQGILSSLGRLNPLNYAKSCIRLVPYGIPETAPSPTEKPFSNSLSKDRKNCIRLLWFGGVYPWFDTAILLQAIAIISKQHDVVLGMVGAKNPFVQHETFHAKVHELEKSIQQLGLQNHVYLFDWVEYEKRADWYMDCDLIITINKEGFENTLAWRTRLVDYVWSGMPVATNGGDPLGEDLIKQGAAARLDISSAECLAKTILDTVSDTEALGKMKETMMSYRPNLYWNKVIRGLVEDIKNHY